TARGWCAKEFTLREPIRASWQRSMGYGLQPDSEPPSSEPQALAVDELYESNRMLLDCAEPALQHLTDRLGHHGNDSLLILVNSQATGLAIEGGGSKWRELRDLQEGACWSEAVRGTNALGTALVEGRPTMIGYGEHFLDRLSICACASVPIRDPQVQIQGLLALDGDGRILAANQRACEFFGMERAQMVGLPGESLITGWQERFEQVRRGIAGHLRTPRGDFFFKTLHLPEAVSVPVSVPSLRKEPATPTLEGLAGNNNPRYLRELDMAARGLRHGLPILLLGETGSGKELVARALHKGSDRADKPFIAVNCAAIPEGLIESELFGYRDGAFTGARRGGMTGRLQQAHGGTLF